VARSGLHRRFLILCLAGVPQAEECLAHPKWDWQLAIQIAAEELILPSLYTAIVRAGFVHVLPIEIDEALRAVHRLNTERNQMIWEEVLLVADSLNTAGMQPILLKGAAFLADQVYPDEGDRYLADIDLLLPSKQLEEAARVLQVRGFLVDTKDRLGMARHHHPPLIRPGKVGIELHHRIGIGSADRVLPAAALLSASELRILSGRRIRVPTPEHLAIHLIAHSQLHHPYVERIWPPLRALYDLRLLEKRYEGRLNWNAVCATFEGTGNGAIYRTHLKQARELKDSTLPVTRIKPLDGVRWFHRSLLWRYEMLRFVDPVYLFHVLFRSRLEILLIAVRTPGQWKYIAMTLFRPNFYRRLLQDLLNR
jgi:hypothetical protein